MKHKHDILTITFFPLFELHLLVENNEDENGIITLINKKIKNSHNEFISVKNINKTKARNLFVKKIVKTLNESIMENKLFTNFKIWGINFDSRQNIAKKMKEDMKQNTYKTSGIKSREDIEFHDKKNSINIKHIHWYNKENNFYKWDQS